MNILDSIIGFFDPGAALRRAHARTILRKYEAASYTRRTKSMGKASGSPDAETYGAIDIIISRSRAAVQNEPYAKKAMRTMANNVIGMGIRPAFSDKMPKLTERWELFADSTNFDAAGKHTFYSMQALIMKTAFQSGSCFIRFYVDKKKKNTPVVFQVLEPDFLDKTKDSDTITQGIELNEMGKPVAYWLYKQHPGSRTLTDLTSVRVPASEVMHIFLQDRPGQIHGIPETATGLPTLTDISDYMDAERVKQKTAATFSAFVSGDPTGQIMGKTDANGVLLDHLEPGTITELQNGQTISFANPPAVDSFSDFTATNLRAVSAAFGTTYENLTNDLSHVNFSSGRMGWIEFSRQVAEWQTVIINDFCKPVWDLFVKFEQLIGNDFTNVNATWTRPRREMIDPVKETNALNSLARAGFNSWSDIVRQLGLDPDTVAAEIKSDLARGLIVESMPGKDFVKNGDVTKDNSASNENK